MNFHLGWNPPAHGTLADAINEILMLMVMIESEEALNNVDAIAATDGVSGATGVGGDFSHPRVQEAWKHIADAAKRHGKALRLGGVKKREDIARTFQLGSRMVITGNDMTTHVKGMRTDLEALVLASEGY